MLVSPFSEEPPEHERALPQLEAPLEDGRVSPQLVESLVRVLVPPSACGAPGVRACCNVARELPESSGGGGALGGGGAVSPETAPQ